MVQDSQHGKIICFTLCLVLGLAVSSVKGQFSRYSNDESDQEDVDGLQWFSRNRALPTGGDGGGGGWGRRQLDNFAKQGEDRMMISGYGDGGQQRRRLQLDDDREEAEARELDLLTQKLMHAFGRDREMAPPSDLEFGDLQMEPDSLVVPKMRFPRLTSKDREFAVNPQFPSYYNPDLHHLEDEIDRSKGPRVPKIKSRPIENSEVGEDPFSTNRQDSRQAAAAGDGSSSSEEAGGGGAAADSTGGVSSDAIFKKGSATQGGPVTISSMDNSDGGIQDVYFTVIVAACSAIAAFTVVLAGIIYHRLQRNAKATEDVEYPAYGVTGPGGKEMSPSGSSGAGGGGDRKLAQNAQMYHYQHQKQQMIAFDSHQNGGNRNRLASDDESDDGEEGDYTVYECPGLAPTGEMEVRNPMFSDDQTTPKAGQK